MVWVRIYRKNCAIARLDVLECLRLEGFVLLRLGKTLARFYDGITFLFLLAREADIQRPGLLSLGSPRSFQNLLRLCLLGLLVITLGARIRSALFLKRFADLYTSFLARLIQRVLEWNEALTMVQILTVAPFHFCH